MKIAADWRVADCGLALWGIPGTRGSATSPQRAKVVHTLPRTVCMYVYHYYHISTIASGAAWDYGVWGRAIHVWTHTDFHVVPRVAFGLALSF